VESGSGVVGQELNHCGEWRMKIKPLWNQLRCCLLVLVARVENLRRFGQREKRILGVGTVGGVSGELGFKDKDSRSQQFF